MSIKTTIVALSVALSVAVAGGGSANACSYADIDSVGYQNEIEVDQARSCSWVAIKQRGKRNQAAAQIRGRAKVSIEQKGLGNVTNVRVRN